MKKTLLGISILLTLIVVYFNCNTEPHLHIGNVAGYNCGFNFFNHIGWKVAGIVSWITYLIYNELKNDDNGDI